MVTTTTHCQITWCLTSSWTKEAITEALVLSIIQSQENSVNMFLRISGRRQELQLEVQCKASTSTEKGELVTVGNALLNKFNINYIVSVNHLRSHLRYYLAREKKSTNPIINTRNVEIQHIDVRPTIAQVNTFPTPTSETQSPNDRWQNHEYAGIEMNCKRHNSLVYDEFSLPWFWNFH